MLLTRMIPRGRPPPAARQRGTHFAIGLASFKKCREWQIAANRYFN
jgi:hypothetical protein